MYGTPINFSGDILRSEFMGRKIRKGRKFDIVIVDEVDNMLYDSLNSHTQLAGIDPGMNHLLPILGMIWNQVTYILSHCYK